MAWLVVLGNLHWSAAGRVWPPGKYEVDEAVATKARRARLRNLRIYDSEPEIVREEPGLGPLTEDDLKFPPRGVKIRGPEIVELPAYDLGEPERPQDAPPADYQCPFCEIARPSTGALKRHIEFHHKGG